MDAITRAVPEQYLDLKSNSSTRFGSSPVPISQSTDAAFEFLQRQRELYGNGPLPNEKELIRKIDFRIVPIMFACYTMQFIDKVNINYAAVMGLNRDLGLQGNEFSWCATAFFIAFLAAEFPTGGFLPSTKHNLLNHETSAQFAYLPLWMVETEPK
ncbi:hypothetical protein TWF694_006110 [Orbilia ellipsospora]|uniref:High-affinity nicotinic acid transporter n=1 Tax=Orbilia ellipsospora TaxID=2528407 RepID=A0AAV9WR98_9PEZI